MAESITGPLEELMPDTVTVEPYVSSGGSGGRNYGPAIDPSPRARISGKMQNVLGSDGQEHVSSIYAVFNGVYNVTVKDRFTLPERFSTDRGNPANLAARQPKALAVENVSDENGPHHEKVYFA